MPFELLLVFIFAGLLLLNPILRLVSRLAKNYSAAEKDRDFHQVKKQHQQSYREEEKQDFPHVAARYPEIYTDSEVRSGMLSKSEEPPSASLSQGGGPPQRIESSVSENEGRKSGTEEVFSSDPGIERESTGEGSLFGQKEKKEPAGGGPSGAKRRAGTSPLLWEKLEGLTPMQKAVVLSEILGKPKGRKR
ncbi:MAG: hypothetical protein ACOC7U_01700 [Spirochaetota bacterium]